MSPIVHGRPADERRVSFDRQRHGTAQVSGTNISAASLPLCGCAKSASPCDPRFVRDRNTRRWQYLHGRCWRWTPRTPESTSENRTRAMPISNLAPDSARPESHPNPSRPRMAAGSNAQSSHSAERYSVSSRVSSRVSAGSTSKTGTSTVRSSVRTSTSGVSTSYSGRLPPSTSISGISASSVCSTSQAASSKAVIPPHAARTAVRVR